MLDRSNYALTTEKDTCDEVAGCVELLQGRQLRGPGSRQGAAYVAVVDLQLVQALETGFVESPGLR